MFIVDKLDPGRRLKLLIYSFNQKGRSDAVPVEASTLKAPEKQTGNKIQNFPLSSSCL